MHTHTHTPRIPCRYCKALNNCAYDPNGELTPQNGDFTICLYCGELSVFDEQLLLCKPTKEEYLEAISDTQLFKAITITRDKYDAEHAKS
jgi:hypothetical protein